jgi:hypothetical protein
MQAVWAVWRPGGGQGDAGGGQPGRQGHSGVLAAAGGHGWHHCCRIVLGAAIFDRLDGGWQGGGPTTRGLELGNEIDLCSPSHQWTFEGNDSTPVALASAACIRHALVTAANASRPMTPSYAIAAREAKQAALERDGKSAPTSTVIGADGKAAAANKFSDSPQTPTRSTAALGSNDTVGAYWSPSPSGGSGGGGGGGSISRAAGGRDLSPDPAAAMKASQLHLRGGASAATTATPATTNTTSAASSSARRRAGPGWLSGLISIPQRLVWPIGRAGQGTAASLAKCLRPRPLQRPGAGSAAAPGLQGSRLAASGPAIAARGSVPAVRQGTGGGPGGGQMPLHAAVVGGAVVGALFYAMKLRGSGAVGRGAGSGAASGAHEDDELCEVVGMCFRQDALDRYRQRYQEQRRLAY